jgi:hypothetical protein
LFRLKIASSVRGTLAGTRCAHLNCNDKKAEESVGAEGLREDRHHNKNTEQTRCIEKTVTHKFFSPPPRGGASGAAAPAATSRSTSRSPAPRGAGPQAATGGSERSRSPFD